MEARERSFQEVKKCNSFGPEIKMIGLKNAER